MLSVIPPCALGDRVSAGVIKCIRDYGCSPSSVYSLVANTNGRARMREARQVSWVKMSAESRTASLCWKVRNVAIRQVREDERAIVRRRTTGGAFDVLANDLLNVQGDFDGVLGDAEATREG